MVLNQGAGRDAGKSDMAGGYCESDGSSSMAGTSCLATRLQATQGRVGFLMLKVYGSKEEGGHSLLCSEDRSCKTNDNP